MRKPTTRTRTHFPVSDVRRYLEPGPIVLVSSRAGSKTNIMTMGWHTVMEFTPSLVGCVIAGSNHSFRLIRASRECVINLPTTVPDRHRGPDRQHQRGEDRQVPRIRPDG